MHASELARAIEAPHVSVVVRGSVHLVRSRLSVQLSEQGDLRFLEVHSRLDPEQCLLLPIGHRPELAGLSMYTRLGWIHSICWGLAYGFGELGEQAVARFRTDTLRYRVSVDARPRRLGDDLWLADVEGVFDSVALLVGDRTVRRAPLAESW